MFSSTPGVNDQTVIIMAAIGGFCRRVESEWTGFLSWWAPASLTSHHPLSECECHQAGARASRRFLPALTFWLWLRLRCPPSLSSNKNKSSPGPASSWAVSSKNWPCLNPTAAARQPSGRSLWHTVWMTTRKWSQFGVSNMVAAGFECIVVARHAVMLCPSVMFSVCSLGPGAALPCH